MAEYVLGVDGGGTKTHCALFNLEGDCVDFLQWGTTNHELLAGGMAELHKTLTDMLDTLRSRNHLDWTQVEAVFGLAGVDSQAQERMVRAILAELGFTRAHVCNDSFLGIQAGSPKPWGICTLNGTGTGACGLDPDGNACHRGGLFALTGDYAGGKVLGGEAARCVYDMLYREGPETSLRELLLRDLHIDDDAQFLEVLLQGITERTVEIKRFAPLLFEAAERGDTVALDILRRSGRFCAGDILDVLRSLNFPAGEEIPVVLIGSLYTKASHPALLEAMRSSLEARCPDRRFQFTVLDRPPVLGAVRWAMGRCGVQLDLSDAAVQLQAAMQERKEPSESPEIHCPLNP